MTSTNSPYPPFHPERPDLQLALEGEEFRREFPEEGQYVEFKQGVGRDPLQGTIVAFSNSDGGVILVGVTDDGDVVGKPHDSGTIDAIHQVMRDVRDPGRYSLHRISVDDRPIIAISIARRREGFAQMSSGVVRVRKGTRDEPLFGSELQQFINERSATRYELTPTSIAVGSANPELSASLGTAFGWGAENLAERLSEHGYATGSRLTVAGALYLTDDPGQELGKAHVELLRYRNDDSVDYDLRIEIGGPLPVQLETAVQRILDELGTELVVLGVRRYDLARVPPIVIREATANALAHRSYELDRTPVRIEIRPSSVLIRSPGGLPEPVTVENIRETSAPRNMSVIRALRAFGLAEDAGRGIDVMEDTMLEEMLEPPRFSDHEHEVVVTLPVRSAVAPVERAWIRELEQRGTLEGPDRLVLVHAARGDILTNAKVREIIQADGGTAREVLHRLRDAGFLEQRGERGGATYRLEGSLEPPAGLRLGADELARLIENLASEGPVSNADVREATGLGRGEVRALLRRLVQEERLIQTGQRRGTRYHAPVASNS
jgi:ATP-dependent DNA helicase RecG